MSTRAVRAAEAGAAKWREAVSAQLHAAPDHADFYALAGSVVETVRALEALSLRLMDQTRRYVTQPGLYDDTRTTDPVERVYDAAAAAQRLARRLQGADEAANQYWNEVGHIGVDPERGGGDRR